MRRLASVGSTCTSSSRTFAHKVSVRKPQDGVLRLEPDPCDLLPFPNVTSPQTKVLGSQKFHCFCVESLVERKARAEKARWVGFCFKEK